MLKSYNIYLSNRVLKWKNILTEKNSSRVTSTGRGFDSLSKYLTQGQSEWRNNPVILFSCRTFIVKASQLLHNRLERLSDNTLLSAAVRENPDQAQFEISEASSLTSETKLPKYTQFSTNFFFHQGEFYQVGAPQVIRIIQFFFGNM